MKLRTVLEQDQLRIKERWYASGLELLRPVNMMISDSYPADIRSTNKVVNDEYERSRARARALLYEQRNLIQEKWVPRYEITYVGEHLPSEDWDELKALLVDGCLDRLAERLIAMCPIMVKTEYVTATEDAVNRILAVETKSFEEYLRLFYVKRKSGVLSIAEEYK